MQNGMTNMSEKTLTELKVMMLVLDPQPNEKVAVFGDAHFTSYTYTLTQKAKMKLDNDVQELKKHPGVYVHIAGYTAKKLKGKGDSVLSEKRANAVRDYLIEKSIAPGRITTIGYGRTKPTVYEVDSGNINSAEAKANMRVLFEIIVQ